MTRRFKTQFDPPDREERKRWIRALKSVGVDGVEARLQQSSGGSPSALHGIGDVQHMTRGLAEAWVEHQRKREGRSAKYWRWATIHVAIGGISGYTLRPLNNGPVPLIRFSRLRAGATSRQAAGIELPIGSSASPEKGSSLP
jgi:hypothetical protein